MPVGDFPTVFSTIMKCWLNSMVTSKNGIMHTYMRCMYVQLQPCTYISDVSKRGVLGSADDDIAFFLHTLSIFIDVFFADHEHVFWQIPAKTANLNLQFTIRCCMFSAYHDIVYCSWKDLFAIYVRILHICSTWKTRDGRKCVKNFGVLGVSGLNK